MKKMIYICDRCGKIIDTPDWFTVFYGVTSSESNVTKTEKLFDEGKARALRNAGWSLEKIADEMKCSPQTVANHLAKSPPEEAA